jgi:hypothetical protein
VTHALSKLEANEAADLRPPNLRFEREDWAAFRTIDGLQQKAGVSKDKLPCWC